MRKFAFLLHPINFEQTDVILGKIPFLNCIPPRYLRKLITYVPPFKMLEFDPDCFANKDLHGYIILCPVFPQHFTSSSRPLIKKRLLQAYQLAEKLNVDVVGLGGFTSIFSNGGTDFHPRPNVKITTGNTYTSSLVIDGLLKICNAIPFDLSIKTLAVIGASGDIGSICSKYLSRYVGKIILVGRNMPYLKLLKEEIATLGPANVEITDNIQQSIKTSHIIITATSSPIRIFDIHDLQKGSIVCDVGYPENTNISSASKRSDIIAFEGGLVEPSIFVQPLPARKKIYFDSFNPANALHGCFAETVLLTMDPDFNDYATGKNLITISKVDKIRELAIRHKFNNILYKQGEHILNIDKLGDSV